MTAIKLRLMGFGLAIVTVGLLIAWAAHSSWQRVTKLSEKLTSTRIASFQTADYFQAHLQKLDYSLLRYELRRLPSDRQDFMVGWTNLNEWIDTQSPTLISPKEREILEEINLAYDDYSAAAMGWLKSVDQQGANADMKEFDEVEAQSQRLLALAYQLVDAHSRSMAGFVADSQKSLGFLLFLIFGSLFVLLILGVWLAGVVYREMIHPLRLQLVESHAIIERQEKLASLGVLAAGVAHEIRNPLTAIKARLFTQQKALRAGSPEQEDAAVIGNEINRLEHIVKGVLEFARPSEPKLAEFSSGSLLREVRELLRPQLEGAGIKLEVQEWENGAGPVIRGDPGQIKQVLINLVQNAAESIGADGRVSLRARQASARLKGLLTPAVILEVEDTGRGMTPEVQKRLFDPFFSTKEAGTGLGLSIAARIVANHGGALEFQTQLNRGTTFGIVLPERNGT